MNFKESAQMLDLPEKDIKNMIYDLMGEGKLSGRIEGDVLIITENVDSFLNELNNQFANWGTNETTKKGKRE